MAEHMLEPGPKHPITVEISDKTVRVTAGGAVIAESVRALVMREADYPPVYYIPRDDVDMTALTANSHTSYCPFKGEASYFSLVGADGENAVWSYEDPYPAVRDIKDCLAFYPSRVDAIEVS